MIADFRLLIGGRQSTILAQQSTFEHGPIAQLGARLNGIEKVASSNLAGSTDNRDESLIAIVL
jgi:hypothetical protein